MKSELVPVGSKAPAFSLPDTSGTVRDLDELLGGKLLLVFFRGFWCETCQGQLARIRAEHEEIVDRGGTTVAISAETVERSRSGRSGAGLPFLVLCDPNLDAITGYGVLHRPEDNGPGIARPSVFLLDRAGVVRFAHVGADPWDRPTIGALILAIESMG